MSLGELRLLRSLQLEINERTAELERRSRDASAGDDGEFVQLAEDQSRLAEIVLSLVAVSGVEQAAPETPSAQDRPTRNWTRPWKRRAFPDSRRISRA